jgi:hypothetical protein
LGGIERQILMRTPALSNRSGLFLLACLALLVGCASPKGKFQSKRDATYKGKLERTLIIYHNEQESIPQLGRRFADALLARLSELLNQNGVVTEIVRPQEGELDENAPVRSAAARFHPRHSAGIHASGQSPRRAWLYFSA